MTLADLAPDLLASAPCFYVVGLDATPAVTLRLYCTPPADPDARVELCRWRHDCTGDLAEMVRAYLRGAARWPAMADWLDAYADELTGIPPDRRAVVGAAFRLQRERAEADSARRHTRRQS